MKTVRAFIAIEMPHTVMEVLERSRRVLQHAGISLRWVRPENVHLTLRFLGDISTDAINEVRNALEKTGSCCSPFSLQVKGGGVFPGPARPRVVWLGIEGDVGGLKNVYKNLTGFLVMHGFPAEKRPFRGHLTIGRVKGRLETGRLLSALELLMPEESPPFTADRLCLFKSDLTPQGAVYSALARVRLQGDRGGEQRKETTI